MTQITLRQAHKLVEKLTARIASVEINPTKEVNAWSTVDADDVFLNGTLEFAKAVTLKSHFIGMRHAIRELVSVANGPKINELVAKRRFLLDLIAMQKQVVAGIPSAGINSAEALTKKIESLRANGSTTSSYYETVTVTFLEAADLVDYNELIQSTQLQVDECEDQLTTANSSTTIALEAPVIEFLKQQKLM